MKTKKWMRFSALLLLLALVLSCAGCQPPEGMYSSGGSDLPDVEAVPFTVWCPEEILGLVTEQVNAYTTMHSETNYQIVVEAKSLEEARDALLRDPMACAEVFAFSSGDLPAMVQANVFSLISRDKPNIMTGNSAGAVSAGKPEEWMYGYPYAVESEYVLVYDKSVYSAEDAASLDSLLDKGQAAGKSVYLNFTDGTATASLFLGAGCTLGYNRNGRPTCDFDGEAGLAAFESVQNYALHSARTEADFLSGLGGEIAAGVVPRACLEDAEDVLGGNFAVTALPACTLGGEPAQMYSIGSYTLFGLRRMLDVNLAPYIMDFCYYLTGADCQLAAFGQTGASVTNLAAMENPDFLLDAAAAALSRQSCCSTPMYQVPGGYWKAVADFAAALPSGEGRALLEKLTADSLA